MIFGILTLITALCISAVAIYYSVAGLVAIFAAAALPIMIMGGVLEVGKLVTAVWLHKYWKQATWWLKSYLSIAVIVLMLITSMGIFGFLSKAHIEQTAQSTDNLARVETLQSEIDRNLGIVGRAENRIRQLESSEVGADANIQTQIDREQERIDKAFERIQPAIQEQNTIIAGVTQLFQNELDKIDTELETLQGYIDTGDIEKAQGMVGTKVDGDYGPKTAAAFTAWQDAKRAERAEWLDKIQQAASSPTVVAAREEIQRLRKSAEDQVTQSQTLITRLQQQLANSDNAEEVQKSIDEQNERVRTASKEIDQLTEEKISLESEYRKLEAEVGPIKYIAEFIYGDTADNNMLEEAVRWVIIIIIFVFDPLAVLLLIAAQYTFEFRKKELEDDDGERLRLERAEYERARAQRIVDNPGFTPNIPVSSNNVDSNEDPHKPGWMFEEEKVDVEEFDRLDVEQSDRAEEGNTGDGDNTNGDSSGGDSSRGDRESVEKTDGEYDVGANDIGRDDSDRVDGDEETVVTVEKKESKSQEELKREADYELKEKDEIFQLNKATWKDANPDQTLKHYKNLYVKGLIDSLPWETPPQDDNYKAQEGYQQNAEQNENTLFNKLSNK